jgi:hypothetical protein
LGYCAKGCFPEGLCAVRFPHLPYWAHLQSQSWSDIEMGPAPIRGQLVYSFARSRFVHNNLFKRLPSTGGEAKLPVIGRDKSKGKSLS